MKRFIGDDGRYIKFPFPALKEADKVVRRFVKKWIKKGYCRRDVIDVLMNASSDAILNVSPEGEDL